MWYPLHQESVAVILFINFVAAETSPVHGEGKSRAPVNVILIGYPDICPT
jgi:hypothetical protein